MGMTLEQKLEDLKNAVSHSSYCRDCHQWFFPSDIAPHSSAFKYQCRKLYEAGLLESNGGGGRWGYQYRVPMGK